MSSAVLLQVRRLIKIGRCGTGHVGLTGISGTGVLVPPEHRIRAARAGDGILTIWSGSPPALPLAVRVADWAHA
jgi:hypothetical protein